MLLESAQRCWRRQVNRELLSVSGLVDVLEKLKCVVVRGGCGNRRTAGFGGGGCVITGGYRCAFLVIYIKIAGPYGPFGPEGARIAILILPIVRLGASL